MFRKLVLAASIVLGLPLSVAQAGGHVGVGIGVPIAAPLPNYPAYYRPYYTPYFSPLPTFYAAPPVYNGVAPLGYNGIPPLYAQPSQTPAYVLPQSQLYQLPVTQPGLMQTPTSSSTPQN
jgi:hypothetical protein